MTYDPSRPVSGALRPFSLKWWSLVFLYLLFFGGLYVFATAIAAWLD